MEGIMELVNETVHAFNSEYNLGKDTAKSLMPFCRPVVEKYLFSKVTTSQCNPIYLALSQALLNVCDKE
jgi:hypothetical protein